MKNTELWDALNRPPKSALKPIKAGRLKGMSDINPQWRYRALTEQFGPCGFGWKYEVNRLWLDPGANGEVIASAQISLYVKLDDKWSEPIPGIGGSKLIAKESMGAHSNDEAYKMAITDALGVAAKMLGVAADVYMGLWDGSKYVDPGVKATPTQKPGRPSMRKSAPVNSPADKTKAIEDMRKIAGRLGWDQAALESWVQKRTGGAISDMTFAQAQALAKALSKEADKELRARAKTN